MLVLPLFAILTLAPLLQGLFDFPLQTAFQAAIFLTCLFPFFWSLAGGRSVGVWFSLSQAAVFAAAALSFFSMLASPVRGLVWFEWANLAAGFLIFIFSGFLSPAEREKTDRAVRASAWGVAILCALQIFVLKTPQISASLTNPNALAFFAIMVIPLALSAKDRALAGVLLLLLVFTRSYGAALALAAAALFCARAPGGTNRNIALFSIFALVLALVIWQVPVESFSQRLLWWKSAFMMFLERPLSGFGHAAFTYVYAAFRGFEPAAEGSIYAHSYYLEFLAENGILCAALWFSLLFLAVKKKTGLLRCSLVAALVHSLFDFGLSVPANLWLFCYLASPGIDRPREEAAPAPRAKIALRALFPAAAVTCAAAWLTLSFTHNKALRELQGGLRAVNSGELTVAGDKFMRSFVIEKGHAALMGLGKTEYLLALKSKDRGRLFSSAVFFERALLLNPYDPSAYANLFALYSAVGENGLAVELARRKTIIFKRAKSEKPAARRGGS